MPRILMVVLLLLGACGSNRAPQDLQDAGSSEELRTEFDFEPYPGSQWYEPNGDEIPEESGIINVITGPAHCNWESAVFLHVGWPLGRDAGDSSESRQYFRDSRGVLPRDSLMTTFDPSVALPKEAENTGYQTSFMELWLHPNDNNAAYLVFADHTERWPRAKETIACG